MTDVLRQADDVYVTVAPEHGRALARLVAVYDWFRSTGRRHLFTEWARSRGFDAFVAEGIARS